MTPRTPRWIAWIALLAAALIGASVPAAAQTETQPRVAPGPSEPDWVAVLGGRYGLEMFDDLLNPVVDDPVAVPGRFRRAGPGPVVYRPEIALGTEDVNHGGYYFPGSSAAEPERVELWSYQYKNTSRDVETDENLPPTLLEGSEVAFDPGDRPFGLWIENVGFDGDGGVYTEPAVVRAVNQRLAAQPYKAMIYPYRDPETGEFVPNSYLIGWEYSTNDDFQDAVCRVENVELVVEPRP